MATFTGTAGNDTANASTSTLTGFTVTGGSGNNLADLQDNVGDTYVASNGLDTIVAGSGNDSIDAGGGNDSVNGGAGNDSVFGGSGNDLILGGDGDDFLRGYSGIDALDGGAGFDQIYFEGTTQGTQAVNVNLATGAVIDEFGNAETIVNFELVRGTRFADTLTGGNTANGTSSGPTGANDGFEGFRGLAGADIINGGNGYDEVRYDHDAGQVNTSGAFGTAAVVVNLSAGTVAGVASNRARDGFGAIDVLTSIEGARGTAGNDTLYGGIADNQFTGMGGNDWIVGGDGFDTVTYDVGNPTTGVVVNLNTGAASDGLGGNDTLSGIQGVRGTSFADTLTGRNFVGFFGDGFRGLAGNDTISGGTGFDETRYDDDVNFGGTGAVIVNLSAATQIGVASNRAIDGFGNTDTLFGIENARGTDGADSFFGWTNNNRFAGMAGNDTLNGGAGNGVDIADYIRDGHNDNGGNAAVIVNLSAAAITVGANTVAANTALDGFGDTDTLIGMEGARGTHQADTLIGNSGRNQFVGFGGNDTMDGGAGTDDEVRYDVDAYEGGTAGVTVNLATGTAVDGFGATDTITGFEIVRGTQGIDSFLGSAAAETFRGLAGNDVIDGAGGLDWVSYSHDIFARQESQTTLNTVIVNLSASTQLGVAANHARDSFGGIDSLTSIENAGGGTLADSFFGSAGNNVFRGLAGNDTIDGGGGIDTADYSNDAQYGEVVFLTGTAAVNVNLATGTATDGFSNTDTLIAIDNAIGTAGNDTLTGNIDANSLTGGLGNDTLTGSDGNDTLIGGGGADSLDGGVGIDQVHYGASAVGVTVNLSTGLGTGGDAQGDQYANIEQIAGSFLADTLIGSATGNTIWGNGGNDVIDGRAGWDALWGQGGNDRFVFSAIGWGSDTIGDFVVNSAERIDFSQIAGLTSMANLAISQVGANTLITYAGNNKITLLNTTASAFLDGSEFLFSPV